MKRSTGWLLFACWAVAGGLVTLGFLTMFTIGVFVMPIALVVVAVLLWRRQSRSVTAFGLMVGAALPLVYVSWLNRAGPGTVCHNTALSESCVDELSPWPWLGAGLIVAAAGVLLFVLISRRELPAPSGRPIPHLGR